jgi:hypothetical protein
VKTGEKAEDKETKNMHFGHKKRTFKVWTRGTVSIKDMNAFKKKSSKLHWDNT